MDDDGNSLIALDVGGTKIRGAIVSGSRVSDARTVSSPSHAGGQWMVDAIAELARSLQTAEVEVKGLAVGTAGEVDPITQAIVGASETIRDWVGVPLKKILEDRVGLPVHVLNDASAFALGEAVAGAGMRSGRVLGITVGTGLGAGFVVTGCVEDGESLAGLRQELIALEDVASGSGLVRRYRDLSGNDGRLRDLQTHDEVAHQLIGEGARALRQVVLRGAARLDADVVVVGGSIPRGVPEFGRLLTEQNDRTPIILALRAEDAALIGAADAWNRSRKAYSCPT